MSKRKLSDSTSGSHPDADPSENCDEEEELLASLLSDLSEPSEHEVAVEDALCSTPPSPDATTIDVSTLRLILVSMGLEQHLMETLGKMKDKARYIINNFGSLLVFIQGKCSLPFDMREPATSTEMLIEHLVNTSFLQIPSFAATYLTSTRSTTLALQAHCD